MFGTLLPIALIGVEDHGYVTHGIKLTLSFHHEIVDRGLVSQHLFGIHQESDTTVRSFLAQFALRPRLYILQFNKVISSSVGRHASARRPMFEQLWTILGKSNGDNIIDQVIESIYPVSLVSHSSNISWIRTSSSRK
mmetsp:Transcript_12717/g.14546  ORF Transcript_12717/g.14546 Transcript_12717/m.14546 type:complete len:137 (-) Transcript_12717:611-1021(-)